MKTLKKSLCLILALVFVLGLCTFGAGAAFTDAADVNYDDAVTVMNGLGILKGYEDGSFQPAKTVTRAEAATMITKMILGEAAAAKLPAASVFADVPANNWAAPYVNYCAAKKIIVGYGDGNFGPNDPVTALQLAKMLLVACGYGEMNEFAPDTWEIYTFTYAVEQGIFDDADVADFAAPATREECALYVFNTLMKIDQVAYDVDFNDYKTKEHSTFGEKTYKLKAADGMVIANQATGNDYTMIGTPVRVEGEEEEPDVMSFENVTAFAAETDASMIGHKVRVYYKTNTSGKPCEAYLVSDLSTVYAVGANPFVPKSLAALAAEMGYPTTDFEDVAYFYDYTATSTSLWDAMVANASQYADYPTYFADEHNLDKNTEVASLTAGKDSENNYYTNAIKLANGKSDTDSSYLPVSALILDEKGEIISALKTGYVYAKVTDIDEEEGTVEYTTCTGDGVNFTEIPNNALIENCYEGVAEGDFVIVELYGEVAHLSATTTTTVQVTQTGTVYGMTAFNGSIFAEFPMAPFWNNDFVDDDDGTYAYPSFQFSGPFPYIHIGSTVKFYLGKNNSAFAAVVIDAVTESDYVLVTDAYIHEDTSDRRHPATNYIVVAVDADGNEVELPVGYECGATKLGVYEIANDAALRGNFNDGLYAASETTQNGVKIYELTPYEAPSAGKISGDNKFLGTESRINGKNFLTSATKYFYVEVDGEYKATVKEVKGLVGEDIVAYYAVETVNGVSNVSTVWILESDNVTIADSYIFVSKSTSANTVYDPATGVSHPSFGIYLDGVSTTILAQDQAMVTFAPGFWTYKVDEDGYYYDFVLSEDNSLSGTYSKEDFYQGALLIGNYDLDLTDCSFVDLTSGYQDAKNFSKAITDADALAEALKGGYYVTLNFIDDDGEEVVGTVYVTGCTLNAPAD